MTISFPCEKCGHKFEVDADLAGKKCKCKKCDHVFFIPTPMSPKPQRPAKASTAATARPPTSSAPKRPKPRAEPAFDPYADFADDPYAVDDPLPPRKASASSVYDDDDLPPPPRIKPTTGPKHRAKQGSGENGFDQAPWLLVKFGTPIVLILSVMALVHSTFWALMVFFTGYIVIACGLILMGSMGQLIIPFLESPACGLMNVFVPFYGLYYAITRWHAVGRWVLTSFCGTGLLVALVLFGAILFPAFNAARHAAARAARDGQVDAVIGHAVPNGMGDPFSNNSLKIVLSNGQVARGDNNGLRRMPVGISFRVDYRVEGGRVMPGPTRYHWVIKGRNGSAKDPMPLQLRGAGTLQGSSFTMNADDGPYEAYIEAETFGATGPTQTKVSESAPLVLVDSLSAESVQDDLAPMRPPGAPPDFPDQAAPATNPLDGILSDLLAADENTRRRAFQKLSDLPREDARRSEVGTRMEAALKDPEDWSRAGAARVLATWGTWENTSALVEALQHESDQGVRAAILDTLKGSKDPSIARAMVKLIEDNRDRPKAWEILKELGPEAEPPTQKLLSHADVSVRSEACKVLQSVGTQSSTSALKDLLARTKGDGPDATAAKEALKAIQDRDPQPEAAESPFKKATKRPRDRPALFRSSRP